MNYFYIDSQNNCFVKILIESPFSTRDIKKGIQILKYTSSSDYKTLCKYVDTINANIYNCAGKEGGCYYPQEQRKITVGTTDSNRLSIGWTAAVIAHEACHAAQLQKKRPINEPECYAVSDAVYEKVIQR